MSELRPEAFPPDPHQHWGPPRLSAPATTSGRPALTTLAIALIGVVVGFVGWFRLVPHHDQTSAPPKPTDSDQQVAGARASVCAASAN
jgi:hypothetical protein